MALLGSQLPFLFQRFDGCRLRQSVGHFQIGCHASIGSRTALALHVGFGGKSRIAEVNVIVDDAGQHKTPRGIYCMLVVATGMHIFFLNVGNDAVVDDDRTAESPAFIHNASAVDQCCHVCSCL